MIHLGVLADEAGWHYLDLVRAADERTTIIPLAFNALQATVGQLQPQFHSGDQNLSELNAIIVRAMPAGSLEQIIFRMDALGQLEQAGLPIFNPPRSLEAAIDKYLSLARLETAGVLVPRTVVCQNRESAMQAFHNLGKRVVVKPLFGSEGRGLALVEDEGVAERTFQLFASLGAVLYVQEFLPHFGYDLRLLVIGDDVFSMRRSNANDWRTNTSRGGQSDHHTATDSQRELALRCSRAIGAPIVGVDLLPTCDGRELVLEVNAVPGWRRLSATLNVDIASRILEYITRSIA